MQGRVVKLLEGEEMIPQSLLPYSAAYEQMVASQLARGAHPIGGEVFSALLPDAAAGGLRFSVRAGECLVLQDLDNHFIDGFLGCCRGHIPHRKPACCSAGGPSGRGTTAVWRSSRISRAAQWYFRGSIIWKISVSP